MTNLLSNAVKYGAENDHIKIYFKETAKNIQVNIEDHGNGIDVKDKNILFEKFTQIHSRKSEIVKGTGLGLNITKNIIEKHDGMISFKSGSEGGTIFYIILPLLN
jgi:signal transduction histidine kinase